MNQVKNNDAAKCRKVLEKEFDRTRREYNKELEELRAGYKRKFDSLLEAIRIVEQNS